MTILEAALLEVTALLDELHLSYMLIGGLAVAEWGEPRATLDADNVGGAGAVCPHGGTTRIRAACASVASPGLEWVFS